MTHMFMELHAAGPLPPNPPESPTTPKLCLNIEKSNGLRYIIKNLCCSTLMVRAGEEARQYTWSAWDTYAKDFLRIIQYTNIIHDETLCYNWML